MNEPEPQPTPDVPDPKVKAWWDRQSPKTRRALLRRASRRAEKRNAREVLRETSVAGYRCTCHRLLPTPELRAACRASHRSAA